MKRYLPLVVGIVVGAVCVRLGVWQLHRLSQRKALNAHWETQLGKAPIDLTESVMPDSLERRRATGRGIFDFEHQVVVVLQSMNGVPGVYVETPLRLDDGTAVLVERGWVPSPDGKTVELAKLTEPDTGVVEGVLVLPAGPAGMSLGDTWPIYVRRPHPDDLESRFPYPLMHAVLRRTELPPTAPAALRPLPLPDLTNGPHLSYAIQWFSFATIAVVGSAILVWKKGGEVGRMQNAECRVQKAD
ncbi:MAG: SURF1 family protein [Gemmatimonadales bacterium]